MKTENVVLIGLAAVAAYALAPKEVKDKVSETLGGGTGINLDLSGLIGDISLPGLPGGGGDGGGIIGDIGDSLGGLFGGLNDSLGGAFGDLNTGLGDAFAGLNGSLADAFAGIDKTIAGLKDQIAGIGTGGGDPGGNSGPSWGENIALAGQGINAGAVGLATGVIGAVGGGLAWKLGSPLLSGLGQGTGALAKSAGNFGAGLFNAAKAPAAAGLARFLPFAGGIISNPITLALGAAGAGIGAGLLFNQTPAGQSLLNWSGNMGAAAFNNPALSWLPGANIRDVAGVTNYAKLITDPNFKQNIVGATPNNPIATPINGAGGLYGPLAPGQSSPGVSGPPLVAPSYTPPPLAPGTDKTRYNTGGGRSGVLT